MNILIENGIILPMTSSTEENSYFKGVLGIEGERISFISDDPQKAEQSFEAFKGDGYGKFKSQL